MKLKLIECLPTLLVALILYSESCGAASSIGTVPFACQAEIVRKMSDWLPLKVTPEVLKWAKDREVNPIVTKGDFDGDGREDTATLGISGGVSVLAICLNKGRKMVLHIIRQPYCDDLIETSKKKSRHYNFETGQVNRLNHDGISVTCFERAGATYVWNGTAFRPLIDSD